MRKQTEALLKDVFTAINDVDSKKIGSNEEQIVSMYIEGNIKIPVIVCYRNDGINGTKAKIAYKSAKVDNKQLYAVAVVPEMLNSEKGVETLLIKTLALRNVIKGEDTITAEANARAEVANSIKKSMWSVNRIGCKAAKASEKSIAKAAKGQYKAAKKVGKTNEAAKANEKFNFFEGVKNFMNKSNEDVQADLADITAASQNAAAQA